MSVHRGPGDKKSRGRSTELWSKLDQNRLNDPFYGAGKFEDFLEDTDMWTLNQLPVGVGTGSTFTILDGGDFGIARLITDGNTATHGGAVQLAGAPFSRKIGRGLFFEALVRVNGLHVAGSSAADMFVGLADKQAAQNIIDSSGVLGYDGIGFTLDANMVVQFQARTSSTVTTKATRLTLNSAALGNWNHLGFYVDPVSNWGFSYVNGVVNFISTAVAVPHMTAAQLPAVASALTPTFAIASGGVDGSMDIDWVHPFMQENFQVRT